MSDQWGAAPSQPDGSWPQQPDSPPYPAGPAGPGSQYPAQPSTPPTPAGPYAHPYAHPGAYSAPVQAPYGESSYGEASFGEASYGQRAHALPVFGQDAYTQPVYGQTPYGPPGTQQPPQTGNPEPNPVQPNNSAQPDPYGRQAAAYMTPEAYSAPATPAPTYQQDYQQTYAPIQSQPGHPSIPQQAAQPQQMAQPQPVPQRVSPPQTYPTIQPPQPEPYPQPPLSAEAHASAARNGLAVTGAVTSIVPLIGLIFSILGLARAKLLGGVGRRVAATGVALSLVFSAGWGVATFYLFKVVGSASTDPGCVSAIGDYLTYSQALGADAAAMGRAKYGTSQFGDSVRKYEADLQALIRRFEGDAAQTDQSSVRTAITALVGDLEQLKTVMGDIGAGDFGGAGSVGAIATLNGKLLSDYQHAQDVCTNAVRA